MRGCEVHFWYFAKREQKWILKKVLMAVFKTFPPLNCVVVLLGCVLAPRNSLGLRCVAGMFLHRKAVLKDLTSLDWVMALRCLQAFCSTAIVQIWTPTKVQYSGIHLSIRSFLRLTENQFLLFRETKNWLLAKKSGTRSFLGLQRKNRLHQGTRAELPWPNKANNTEQTAMDNNNEITNHLPAPWRH